MFSKSLITSKTLIENWNDSLVPKAKSPNLVWISSFDKELQSFWAALYWSFSSTQNDRNWLASLAERAVKRALYLTF